MANKNCIVEVAKHFQEKEDINVDVKDLAGIVDDLERGFAEANAKTNQQRAVVLEKFLKQNKDAVDFASSRKMMKEAAKLDFFDRANKLQLDNKEKAISYYDVLEAELVGSQANLPGYRNSIDANTESIKAQYVGNFLYELDEAGLTKLVTSNKYSADNVAKELFTFSNKDVLEFVKKENEVRSTGPEAKYDVYEGYDPKVSGDKEAYAIAKIIAKNQHELVIRANRAGAFIKLRSDYIVKQSHNADRLHSAGIKKWKQDIIKLLDQKETFGNRTANEATEMLDMAFHDIVYGSGDTLGGANIRVGQASKLSRSRSLHFKSDKDFMVYNKLYGNKELMDTFLGTVNSMSRDIALMEKFGPNAGRTFDEILSDIANNEARLFKDLVQNKDLPPEVINKLFKRSIKGKEYKLKNQFAEVSGAANIPLIGMKGDLGKFIRGLHNLSKLGGAAVSAFADAGFLPFEANYQGMGFAKSFVNGIKQPVIYPLRKLFANKSHRQRQQLARQIGIGMDYLTASAMDKFSVMDVYDDVGLKIKDVGPVKAASGLVGSLQKKFFKLNGLTWITDTFKTAFTMMAANNLGVKSDSSWKHLGDRLTSVLSKYGINEKDWDLIRQTAFKDPNDNNMYITPDKIRYLSDEAIEEFLPAVKTTAKVKTHPATIAKVKIDLETKLRAYFVDRADFASPTPGAKERALMYQGMEPGTTWGEVARFFWQYKSFAVTILNKVYGREINGKYSNTSMTARMAGITALTSATGLVSYSVKQLLKGQVPEVFKEDLEDIDAWDAWKLARAGFMQGGGGGIYADLLFSTNTRYGQSWLASAGGPTAGLVEDFSKIVGVGVSLQEEETYGSRASTGKKAALAATRVVKGLVPGGNLPGAKPMLDTYLWYRWNESLNPGYVRRLKRSQRKRGVEWNIEPQARYLEDDIMDLFE